MRTALVLIKETLRYPNEDTPGIKETLRYPNEDTPGIKETLRYPNVCFTDLK